MWIKKTAAGLHRLLSCTVPGARCYLAVCRAVAGRLSKLRRQQLLNSLATVRWPEAAMPPQSVLVGGETVLRMHPHNGEFDFAAVLGGRLEYEREVFAFLDARMHEYDVILEIGANVGVFTLYFGKQLAKHGGRVYAFEPSSRAFSRLVLNLQANDFSNIFPFNAAVGARTAFDQFHEPEGCLTNGSLIAGFAAQFSSSVSSVPVLVIDGALLKALTEASRRVLVKIDVEGYEASLVRALAPLIAAKQPDILLEVLPEFEAEIGDAVAFAAPGYELHAITAEGLSRQTSLKAVGGRDCFLTPGKPGHGPDNTNAVPGVTPASVLEASTKHPHRPV